MNDDPWSADIPNRYQPGQLIKGKVTKITNFGVFVGLEDGLEGLLHISELSDEKICLLYTSPSPRDGLLSRMPSSA